ncbi:hypothetical protein L9G16_23900, partial [Shewanella sp. A25]|nr:hypothetical protein [Shewanella shenzhenensis]
DALEQHPVKADNPKDDYTREAPGKLMAVFLKGEPPKDLSGFDKYATQGEQVAPGPRSLYVA